MRTELLPFYLDKSNWDGDAPFVRFATQQKPSVATKNKADQLERVQRVGARLADWLAGVREVGAKALDDSLVVHRRELRPLARWELADAQCSEREHAAHTRPPSPFENVRNLINAFLSPTRVTLFAAAIAIGGCGTDEPPGSTDDTSTGADTTDGGTDIGVDPIEDTTVDPIDDTVNDTVNDTVEDPGVDTGDDTAPDADAAPECGDGTVDDGEDCDDGNTDDGDGCAADCTSEAFCGDGNLDDGEECDDGNNDDGDDCSAECLIEAGEACDPCTEDTDCGGDADFCVETADGSFCAMDCGEDAGVCGEGESCVDLLEEDGETVFGSVCQPDSNRCTAVECGDGFVDEGEECDDGNTVDGDDCSAICEFESFCGDGTVDEAEACDDGNTDDGDGCSALCEIELFGCAESDLEGATGAAVADGDTSAEGTEDGFNSDDCGAEGAPDNAFTWTAPGAGTFQFDTEGSELDTVIRLWDACPDVVGTELLCNDDGVGIQSLVQREFEDGETVLVVVDGFSDGDLYLLNINPVVCGDGIMVDGEECDDGNTDDGDGCSALCVHEIRCGDTLVEGDEECDDGNTDDGDGCSALCVREPACGDGFLDDGEECDDGNEADGDGCSALCVDEWVCQDGDVDPGEECDDGNPDDGDGCSAACFFEHACGDGTVEDGEECDDGNTEDGDGCNSACYNEGRPIDDGGDFAGGFAADGTLTYTFTVHNDATNITAETGDGTGDCPGDTLITLTDAADAFVASDDDGGEGLCSLLAVELVLGDYTLTVSGFGGTAVDPYTLTADLWVDLLPGADAPYDGGFDAFGRDFYRFDLDAAATVSAGTSDGLGACPGDTILTLNSIAEDGTRAEVARNDDSFSGAGGLCSFLTTDLEAGSYEFVVTGFSSRVVDPYVLSVGWPEAGSTCGDGALDEGEECDDSNVAPGDGCSATCELEWECGEGEINSGENCDDGNTDDGDGCSALCVREPACGDTFLDEGEECDDGNLDDADGCSALCVIEHVCGNDVLTSEEECDDGNTDDGDGCSALCIDEWVCADGDVDPSEECDDGNTDDGDECSAGCLFEHTCGDGVVEAGEECDDGNTDDGDDCNAACYLENQPVDDGGVFRGGFTASGSLPYTFTVHHSTTVSPPAGPA